MISRILILLACTSLGSFGEFTPEQLATLPPPAERAVDFKKDIKPLLEESCIKCHGRGKAKGGFAIDNRDIFLKGGDSGPGAVPGKSSESLVVHLVAALDPDNVMPQKGSKLTAEEVGLVRKWIDDGLPWDEGVTFAKLPPVNLHPRKPSVPEVSGVENPVDRFVWSDFKKSGVNPGKVVDDRIFARRVYLDTIGLLPTPAELESFIADKSPKKRLRLVQKLLDRDLEYAQHWLTFWNDALRNDYKGTGYIDGGRKQITSWLFTSLAQNKPYDDFVAELVNPTPESEGFAKGIVWRGVVNASQTPEMQAAQNISQVFMGVNLKCASCHDSFINDWTLADAYGLASIYADGPLEMFKCDQPTGQKAPIRFLFPELGEFDATVDRADRLKHLAKVVTSETNGRLSRTIVNRLWARFLGRGLVEPVDEMANSAWNQDLLDWLAADLADHDYDLKHTMELILSSKAYQLPTVTVAEGEATEFVFKGPLIRRMSAEQFIDSVSQLTGVWDRSPAAQLNLAALSGEEFDPSFKDQRVQPKWIWSDARAASKAEPGTIYLRKLVNLPKDPTEASLIVSCDNWFKLFINGKEVATGKDHTKPSLVDARKHLREGLNLIAVAARNHPGAPTNSEADQTNPAGFWLYARVRNGGEGSEKGTNMDFGTDSSWIWTFGQQEGWNQPEFPAANWQLAAELGGPDGAPWKLGKTFAQSAANAELYRQVRASFANNDALMTALGRPNREQVVTSRASVATTLQALELTNGSTLATHLKKAGAELAQEEIETEQLINKIYAKAFGRKPTAEELALSREMVGSPVQPEGVEDLLWAMTMLPEFQLIY